jgi:hypothetical protein
MPTWRGRTIEATKQFEVPELWLKACAINALARDMLTRQKDADSVLATNTNRVEAELKDSGEQAK